MNILYYIIKYKYSENNLINKAITKQIRPIA